MIFSIRIRPNVYDRCFPGECILLAALNTNCFRGQASEIKSLCYNQIFSLDDELFFKLDGAIDGAIDGATKATKRKLSLKLDEL